MSWMSPLTVRAQDRHAGLHRVGGEQHLRHEQDAVAEILADDAHALDQRLGEHVIGRPLALQQDVDAFLDFFLQPVIEVVVHLLHEFVVGQFGEDDIVIGHGGSTIAVRRYLIDPAALFVRAYVLSHKARRVCIYRR